jgi:hypothetical protein
MYAQWRRLAPQEALTIAKFEPGIYDVVESFAPPRDEM